MPQYSIHASISKQRTSTLTLMPVQVSSEGVCALADSLAVYIYCYIFAELSNKYSLKRRIRRGARVVEEARLESV